MISSDVLSDLLGRALARFLGLRTLSGGVELVRPSWARLAWQGVVGLGLLLAPLTLSHLSHGDVSQTPPPPQPSKAAHREIRETPARFAAALLCAAIQEPSGAAMSLLDAWVSADTQTTDDHATDDHALRGSRSTPSIGQSPMAAYRGAYETLPPVLVASVILALASTLTLVARKRSFLTYPAYGVSLALAPLAALVFVLPWVPEPHTPGSFVYLVCCAVLTGGLAIVIWSAATTRGAPPDWFDLWRRLTDESQASALVQYGGIVEGVRRARFSVVTMTLGVLIGEARMSALSYQGYALPDMLSETAKIAGSGSSEGLSSGSLASFVSGTAISVWIAAMLLGRLETALDPAREGARR